MNNVQKAAPALISAGVGEWAKPSPASDGYDAWCSKCRSANIKTRHIATGSLINSSSTANVNNEFIASSEYDYFYKLTAKTEHLLKTCECGYSWRERVAS